MTESSAAILGKNIHRLRNDVSMTQEKLAESCELSLRYIQELEAGEKTPSLQTFIALRKSLKTTWDQLLKGL